MVLHSDLLRVDTPISQLLGVSVLMAHSHVSHWALWQRTACLRLHPLLGKAYKPMTGLCKDSKAQPTESAEASVANCTVGQLPSLPSPAFLISS